MPSYEKGHIIGNMRIRRNFARTIFEEADQHKDTGISRYEIHGRSPREDRFNNLMYKMGLPVETFFHPFLDDSTLDVYGVREQLFLYLHWAPYDPLQRQKAEVLIMDVGSTGAFDAGLNRQLVLGCIARLYEIQHKPPGEILDLTREGIAITHPEFDPEDFKGDALLFNEPQLIHMQALAYARMGKTNKAINLLHQIKDGLAKAPQDDYSKEAFLAPVMLDLSRLLADAGEYGKALEICETGNLVSLKRNRGKYTPDFVFNMAKVLYHQGNKSGSRDLLQSAFWGFSLMRVQCMAQDVLAYANGLGFGFETYDLENLPIPDLTVQPYSAKAGANLGAFICGLRKDAGVSIEALCEGICNKSTLSRIEKNKAGGSVYILEAIMQRLGRDPNRHFDTFLSYKDFMEKQMRDDVLSRLARGRYDGAEVLLDELEANGVFMKRDIGGSQDFYKYGVNWQFIKMARATIYSARHGNDAVNMDMLMDAWRTTRGELDEDAVAKTRLSYNEVVILNQIGLNLCETGEQLRGVRLFESLRKSMDSYYLDESEKMRMYPALLYNYSKHLGRMGTRKEALKVAIEGDEICAKYSDLDMMSSLAINRAFNLQELGQEEKSVSIFAQAYYCSGLVEKTADKDIIGQHVKRRFDVAFS